jgi:IS1 family transposase
VDPSTDHESGEVIAFWFGRREHENLDRLLELLKPLNLGKVYTDGNYAYYERFSPEVLTVTKKNTQKIERKHLSLRTWSARLVRKRKLRGGPRFLWEMCRVFSVIWWKFYPFSLNWGSL